MFSFIRPATIVKFIIGTTCLSSTQHLLSFNFVHTSICSWLSKFDYLFTADPMIMSTRVSAMDSLTNGSSMQSQPDEITQNKDQDQSQTKKGRTFDEKADWDAETTKIWIGIGVGEVLAGNKPNTHFSKLGWRNLIAKFTKATGKKYDRSQHKNHWDTYKRKWLLWKYLVDGENDLGWDPVRQTVVASDEWWNANIEKCPKVAMFKSKGLQHKDKLDILFSKPAAIGSTPQADSSNALPIQMETSEKDDTSFSNDDQEDENLVPVDIDSQVAVNRAQKRICSENCLGRRKKRSCLA
ncbi:hypothetical protein Sjap_001795 [Stephania japonica]|uniref:Myb/SANT-like domain-containing protein n=1 Tax=Stephania japonica TaxID=461633 RepID=A0AAP0PTL3_9MAGN